MVAKYPDTVSYGSYEIKNARKQLVGISIFLIIGQLEEFVRKACHASRSMGRVEI
jgi:hypothetical protein